MLKLSKMHFAVLALIVTNIVWGASSPIFKWAMEDIPPYSFAFLRFLLAALILLPFTLHKLKVRREDIIKLCILAFFGFFIHIALLLVGLTISSSINSPIIASSAPVFLLLGSFFFLKEKIKKKMLIGTLVSLLGVMIIILRPLFDHGLDGTIIGNLLFLVSTISFVVYTILLKDYKLPYSSVTLTFYMFALSTIIFLPFSLWELQTQSNALILSSQSLLGILFAAIFTSVLGYVLYNYAIRFVKANETGIFLYIDPVIAVLIAVPLLGEHVTTSFIIGSILVFAGIFIAEKRIHYHPLHHLKRPHSL